MKRFVLLPLLVVGCASSSEFGAERRAVALPTPEGTTLTIIREGARSSGVVSAPAEKVWPAVLQSYADLGLPLTAIDPAAQMAAMQNHRVREIRGRHIAHFFDCAGAYGNSALRSDVFTTVQTRLFAQGTGGTRVQIEVDATARGRTQGTRATCSSTGALERELIEQIRQKSVAAEPEGDPAA